MKTRKSILKTPGYAKKLNPQTVRWQLPDDHNDHKESKKPKDLIKIYRFKIVTSILSKFKGSTILADESYLCFLDDLHQYLLKPLDAHGYLKNKNLAEMTEIALDNVFLQRKKKVTFFRKEEWVMHINTTALEERVKKITLNKVAQKKLA